MKHYLMLTRVFTVGVFVGSQNPAYSMSSLLSKLLERKELLELMLAIEHGVDLDEPFNEAAQRQASTAWTGMAGAIDNFNDFPDRATQALVYQSRPGILIHERTYPYSGKTIETIDIVDLAQRAVSESSGQIRFSTHALMDSGIWATLIEGSLLPDDRLDSWNTARAIDAARSSGDEVLVLRPEAAGKVANINADKATKARMLQDLETGHVVVVPTNSGKPEDGWLAWWRINPESGETLGIGKYGGGSETVKYSMLKVGVAVGLTAAAACYGEALAVGGTERVWQKRWTCAGLGVNFGCFAATAAGSWTAFWMNAAAAGLGGKPVSAPGIGGYCLAVGAILTLGFNVPNVGD